MKFKRRFLYLVLPLFLPGMKGKEQEEKEPKKQLPKFMIQSLKELCAVQVAHNTNLRSLSPLPHDLHTAVAESFNLSRINIEHAEELSRCSCIAPKVRKLITDRKLQLQVISKIKENHRKLRNKFPDFWPEGQIRFISDNSLVVQSDSKERNVIVISDDLRIFMFDTKIEKIVRPTTQLTMTDDELVTALCFYDHRDKKRIFLGSTDKFYLVPFDSTTLRGDIPGVIESFKYCTDSDGEITRIAIRFYDTNKMQHSLIFLGTGFNESGPWFFEVPLVYVPTGDEIIDYFVDQDGYLLTLTKLQVQKWKLKADEEGEAKLVEITESDNGSGASTSKGGNS